MDCLENITTLGLCPDAGESTSGFTLLDADGISIKNLAEIADDSNIKGVDLAMSKKSLSINQFYNDFIASLHANKVMTNQSEEVYKAAEFVTNSNNGVSNESRGLTLHRVKQKGKLRKLIIDSIEIYPLTSGNVTVKVDDGINTYTYDIDLIADQVNVLDGDVLDDFPFALKDNVCDVRITVETNGVLLSKSQIICLKGCNGTTPNDCGWVDGWDGSMAVKKEGYGVNVNFHCECDYASVLCNMPKTFIGELIWLKWQINIYKEHLKSNRFNNWVIYNDDRIQEYILPELQTEYTDKWNALMQGLPEILKTYQDSCLICRGARWVVTL